MTTHGQPDQSRSARYVLKDYVSVSFIFYSTSLFTVMFLNSPLEMKRHKENNRVLMAIEAYLFFGFFLFFSVESLQGKLLYCHPPPLIDPKDFQPQHLTFVNQSVKSGPSTCRSKPRKVKQIENTVDKTFFHQVRHLPKSEFS